MLALLTYDLTSKDLDFKIRTIMFIYSEAKITFWREVSKENDIRKKGNMEDGLVLTQPCVQKNQLGTYMIVIVCMSM